MPLPGEQSATGKTTTLGTAYTEYLIWPGGDSANPMLVCVPTSAPEPTMLLTAHGYNGTEATINNSQMVPTTEGAIDRGWTVASSYGGGNGWGNAASLAIYATAAAWAVANLPVSPTKIILHGQSMGALVMANIIQRGLIPNVVAFISIDGALSLATAHASGTYQASVRTAYGIDGTGSNYATQTAGYDAATFSDVVRFIALPIFISASTGDTSIVKGSHSDAFVTNLAGAPYPIVYPTGSGAHVTINNYFAAEALDFAEWALAPTSIPPALTVGLVSRHHIGTLAGAADNDPISSWANLVSGGVALTGSGSARPLYRTSGGINVRQPARASFDGVDDALTAAIGTIAQPSTRIIVARLDTVAASKTLVGSTNASTNRNALSLNVSSAWNMYAGVNRAGPASPAPDTAWHCVAGFFSGASSFMRVDSAVGGVSTAGTESGEGLRLAANTGLSVFTNESVSEVLVYNRVLTTTEVDAIIATATHATFSPAITPTPTPVVAGGSLTVALRAAVSGSAPVVAAASLAVGLRAAISGSAAAVTAASLAVALRAAISGSASVVSGTSLDIGTIVPGGVSGTTPIVSDTSLAIGLRAAVSGTAPVVSASTLALALRAAVSGTAPVVSASTLALALRAAISGSTPVLAGGSLSVATRGAVTFTPAAILAVMSAIALGLIPAGVTVLGSHAFVIKPGTLDGHDVELHKRRAKAIILGRPLAKSDSVGMTGPDVVPLPDGSASFTYSLIG